MAKQSTVAASRRSAPRPVARPAARRTHRTEPTVRWGIPLTKMNLFVLLGGIAIIVIGYMLMATAVSPLDQVANNDGVWNNSSAVTVAPVLLALGYLVIIPIGLFYRFKGKDAEGEDVSAA